MPMVSCDGTCKVSTNYTGTIIREYASKLEKGSTQFTAALMQARAARGARIHDYWQEAA